MHCLSLLISACEATIHERTHYISDIRVISTKKLLEYNTLPEHRRWIWILGGGTIRESDPNPVRNNRILPARAGIIPGKIVTPVRDKTNEDLCTNAYNEYLEIISGFEHEHIRVYTDGSHSPTEDTTGYGIRIIGHSRGSETVLMQRSEGLGNASINEAELTAVHEALNWLIHKYKRPLGTVHIFTDSKYAFNASTSVVFRRKNFHLIQEIRNLGHRIGDLDNTSRPVMHYVPSHIEYTSQGKNRTGNYYAGIHSRSILMW